MSEHWAAGPISGSVVLWFPFFKFAFALRCDNALLTLTVAHFLKSKVAQCSVCLIYTFINLSDEFFPVLLFSGSRLAVERLWKRNKKGKWFVIPPSFANSLSNRNMCKVCVHLDILLFLLFIRRKILKTLMLVGKSICLGEMEEFRELIWYLLKSLTTWFPYFLSLQTASFNSGTCPWVR